MFKVIFYKTFVLNKTYKYSFCYIEIKCFFFNKSTSYFNNDFGINVFLLIIANVCFIKVYRYPLLIFHFFIDKKRSGLWFNKLNGYTITWMLYVYVLF